MTTYSTVLPILRRTYGRGSMIDSLAEHLAERIDTYNPEDDRDSRERMVMHICWNWMPGGTTAESVAREIEVALQASSSNDSEGKAA